MEQGLASTMVYGSGQGQNTTHYYAGDMYKPKRKKKAKLKKNTKVRDK